MLEKLSKVMALIVPYFIVVSLSYQVGFWGTFGIDFYSYITASDIISLSIYPLFLITTIVTLLFYVYIKYMLLRKKYKNIQGRKINIINDVGFYSILFFLIILFFLFKSISWYIFLCISLLIITEVLSNFFEYIYVLYESEDVKKINMKFSIFIILLFVFVSSFSIGRIRSNSIINNESYRYVAGYYYDKKNIKEIDQRYIGKIDKYIFMYIRDNNSVVIDNIENMTPFEIRRFTEESIKIRGADLKS